MKYLDYRAVKYYDVSYKQTNPKHYFDIETNRNMRNYMNFMDHCKMNCRNQRRRLVYRDKIDYTLKLL